MEKPILIYEKHADLTTHKMILPQKVVDKWGCDYYMEVYENKIILIPKKKEG